MRNHYGPTERNTNRRSTYQQTSRVRFPSLRLALSIIIILFVCHSFPLYSQNWQFGTRAGGTSNDYSSRIAVDSDGNSIVTGEFSGSITFDTITLVSQGTWSLFLAKYTPEGRIVWATTLASTQDVASDIYANALALDSSGNIYVAGNFLIDARFSDAVLQSIGTSDIYLAKLTGTGHLVWVRQAGGTGEGTFAQDAATALALDKSGNCYMTGYYNHNAMFDSITISSPNSSEIFIAKYDVNGNALWATTSGSFGAFHMSFGIGVDGADNCYVTGKFFNGLSFGGDTLDAGDAEQKIFIAKLDANGSVVWAKKVGSGGYYGVGLDLAVERNGDFYISGYFRATMYLDETTLSRNDGLTYGVIVARYDNTGKFVWAIQSNGGNATGSSLSLDRQGGVFVTGTFLNTISFGTTELASPTPAGGGAFVTRFDTHGNCQWIKGVVGSGVRSGHGFATTGSGDCVITGTFSDTVTVGSTQLISMGGSDIFVARIGETSTGVEKSDDDRGYESIFYPNPATDVIRLREDEPHRRIQILSLYGTPLLETGYTNLLDISGLASGVYFLKVDDHVYRFVKL